MEKIIVLSFYKYVDLNNLEYFQKEHSDFCNNLGIKGKVLISNEGINGSISGTEEQISKYKQKLNSYKEFSDICFKETETNEHPFRKTIVRIRKEIVSSGFDVDVKYTGKHLSPKELKNLYDSNNDFVIIDARNNYESLIGKFKNAIIPNIETFRDFKSILPQLKQHKDKKVVLYCTGGVRCEKASSLLIKDGFTDVNQVDGGIFNYIQQYPGTYFEGRCFVFDNRLTIETGDDKEITICEKCQKPCGEYINCANIKCDKLFVCCDDCRIKFKSTCSRKCKSVLGVKLREIKFFKLNEKYILFR